MNISIYSSLFALNSLVVSLTALFTVTYLYTLSICSLALFFSDECSLFFMSPEPLLSLFVDHLCVDLFFNIYILSLNKVDFINTTA